MGKCVIVFSSPPPQYMSFRAAFLLRTRLAIFSREIATTCVFCSNMTASARFSQPRLRFEVKLHVVSHLPNFFTCLPFTSQVESSLFLTVKKQGSFNDPV